MPGGIGGCFGCSLRGIVWDQVSGQLYLQPPSLPEGSMKLFLRAFFRTGKRVWDGSWLRRSRGSSDEITFVPVNLDLFCPVPKIESLEWKGSNEITLALPTVFFSSSRPNESTIGALFPPRNDTALDISLYIYTYTSWGEAAASCEKEPLFLSGPIKESHWWMPACLPAFL